MKIIAMRQEHLPSVAHLHACALAGDFLPSLGERFLQVFYRTALRSGSAFGYVCEEADSLVGFVLGSGDSSSLFRQVILKAAPALGLAAVPAVLKRPGLIRNIAETFFYPSRESGVEEQAELMVIAVEAGQRGRGIGEALVQALNSGFAGKGIYAYKVTVLQANAGANRFYRRLGFQPAGQFTLYRKAWNILTYEVGALTL